MGRAKRDPDTSTYSGRVAARLAALMAERGVTVEELRSRLESREIVLSSKALWTYLNNTRTLPPDLYPVVADALGVAIHDLLPPG